jgi:hypothetical protein
MAEGCKMKGMHKSMLCQLLNPENFSGHFRFWNSFILSKNKLRMLLTVNYFLIDVKQIIYLSTLFAAEPEVMTT